MLLIIFIIFASAGVMFALFGAVIVVVTDITKKWCCQDVFKETIVVISLLVPSSIQQHWFIPVVNGSLATSICQQINTKIIP